MIEKICNNCRLFNSKGSTCGVNFIYEGEYYELMVRPQDSCHWERIDTEAEYFLLNELKKEKNPVICEKIKKELETPLEIQQVRLWSDGKNGYIESP